MTAIEAAKPSRILVIKHGAIGDFVCATGAMAAIRAHHPDAEITLLTTRAMLPLAEACPYFDVIRLDTRPSWTRPWSFLSVAFRLSRDRFDRIYDLQCSHRTANYFRLARLFGLKSEWCGKAKGATYLLPSDPPPHPVERYALQLSVAGIPTPPPPALPWLEADVSHFAMPDRFILLAPGGSPHRPEKRWPAEHFAALARAVVRRRVAPVVVGGPSEKEAAATIVAGLQGARDLTGATTLAELYALARLSMGAAGNDTGPMHVIAASGAPSVVLFGPASDPERSAPRGPDVRILRRAPMSGLSVGEVEAALGLR